MKVKEILEEKLVERSYYLEEVKKWIGAPLIKVIVGARRVWKSVLLQQTIQYLVSEKKLNEDDVFYLNMEDPRNASIKTYEDLVSLLLDFMEKHWKHCFIGIDEIQWIQGWEKAINGILAMNDKAEIFITGSNSNLLSWELATYLSWRYIEIPVYPLSFSEYLQFSRKEKSMNSFFEFLTYWGLPWIFKLVDFTDDSIFSYLRSVYNTIILKDIVNRFWVRNIDFFDSLYTYILANVGNIISAKKISDYLKSQKVSMGVETILNYLKYWEFAYIFWKLRSEDIKTKKIFDIYNKYYVGDLWIRNSVIGVNLERDVWNLLENYIYILLKKYWYEIAIWRVSWNKEIDFIGTRFWRKVYVQVATSILGQETSRREFSALEQVDDNREKYVVTMDSFNTWFSWGIQHVNAMDFEDILISLQEKYLKKS